MRIFFALSPSWNDYFRHALDARPTAEQREDDTLPDRSDEVDDMMLDVTYRFLSAEGRLRTMTPP
jgi:hypothetical protein